MRRDKYFIGILCAALAGQAGCFPYLYPRLDGTPGLKLDLDAEEVRVFRVDIDQFIGDMMVARSEQLTEVTPWLKGHILPSVRPSVTAGIGFIGPLTFKVEGSHDIALRLYRPGYELVEFTSWQPVRHIDWIPARDLAAQEVALDRLFPFTEYIVVKERLSTANRAALLFGAAEYQRLANLATEIEQQNKLLDKANHLREIAER